VTRGWLARIPDGIRTTRSFFTSLQMLELGGEGLVLVPDARTWARFLWIRTRVVSELLTLYHWLMGVSQNSQKIVSDI
jgi:hypothetical protein